MNDIVVTVTNPGAANVSLSNGSVVNATVGNGGVVNVAIGTISPGNATVVAGTLTINSTSTLSYGNAAYVKNVGTSYAASLDIGIPAGPPTTVLVGNTTTLSSGNASVTGVANGSNLTLSFAIPRGASGINGTTPSFAVGNVTTLAAGGSATVTATPSNGGANVTLNFAIPRGVDGTGGGSSNLTVSDATPSNLGVASAGTSNLASRSDHTHNLPVISYANLTGVPSNFPSNIGSVSGLQSALDAKQSAGNYLTTAVTGVNNLTGNLSLIAAGGLSIAANGSTLTLTASADVANSTIDGGDYVGQLLYGITFGTQPQSVTANTTTSVTISSLNVTANFPTQGAVAVSGGLLSLTWVKVDGQFWSPFFIASTNNGTTWSQVFTGEFYSYAVPDMPITTASNGTRTVIGTYRAFYSNSPTTSGSWADTGAGDNATTPYAVAYGSGKFVAICRSPYQTDLYGSTFTLLTVNTSPDAVNWTSRAFTAPSNALSQTFPVTSCRKPLVVVGGKFVVCARASFSGGASYGFIWTSSDGVTWTPTQFDSAQRDEVFFDMVSTGTVAVGVDGTTTARYTTDGTTWTSSTLPVACNRISYAGGLFWAFNGSVSGTDVCYSANGQSWTLGTMPVSSKWESVAGGSTAFALANPVSGGIRYATATIGTTYASANLTVSATATGGASVAYQWQQSLDAGTNWSDINGATNTTLSLSNLTTANSGTRYRAVASSTGAALGYSQSATLTVTG